MVIGQFQRCVTYMLHRWRSTLGVGLRLTIELRVLWPHSYSGMAQFLKWLPVSSWTLASEIQKKNIGAAELKSKLPWISSNARKSMVDLWESGPPHLRSFSTKQCFACGPGSAYGEISVAATLVSKNMQHKSCKPTTLLSYSHFVSNSEINKNPKIVETLPVFLQTVCKTVATVKVYSATWLSLSCQSRRPSS